MNSIKDQINQEWRSNNFRQHIRNTIEEALKHSNAPLQKNVSELELQIFSKAGSREEYLHLTARLIHFLKESNQKQQQTMQIGQPINAPPTDPMSALQNLASFPSNDQHNLNKPTLTSNVQEVPIMGIVTVNSTPVSIHMTTVGAGTANMQQMAAVGNPQAIQQINAQSGIQLQQMTTVNAPQMQPQMISVQAGPQIVQQRIGMPQNRMMLNEISMPVHTGTTQMSVPITNQRPQMIQRMRQPANTIPIQAQQTTVSDGTFYQGQVVNRPQHVQNFQNDINAQFQASQATIIQNQGSQVLNTLAPPNQVNQITASMSPSPNSYVPSPQGLMPSPMSVGMLNPRATGSVPSPSPLNTPVMVPTASPATRMISDEQVYMEKLKQLSRFIEPLRAMIAKFDRDDGVFEKKKEISKIRNLLHLISEPNKRIPMETLLKCEQVLEKMEFSHSHSNSHIDTSAIQVQTSAAPHSMLKTEHNIGQPLIDALVNNMKKPFFQHTLHRTFASTIAALASTPYYR